MAKLKEWCDTSTISVNSHTLTYLEADAAKLTTAIANVATTVPGHYAASSRVAGILATLGKTEAAAFIATKLPAGPRSRSGDIGEILATAWVTEFTSYKIGVLKLRWKDHRDMAMRGDDILAVRLDPDVTIRFLKGEVKSRSSLAKQTVEEARAALMSEGGLPTPHALSFVSDRLFETGHTDLSELIDLYQLKKGIKVNQVSHLMFMFTGNDPSKLLKANLFAYDGKIRQHAVGLRVHAHQDFIKQICAQVIADGNSP